MISVAIWMKVSSGITGDKRLALAEIDAAIRKKDLDAAKLAVAGFKATNSGRADLDDFVPLIEYLDAHLGDDQSQPSKLELEDVRYQMNPYVLPVVWDLKLSDESIAAWNKSTGASATWHTFIGITHKVTGASYIYPCFMEDSSGARVFNPAMMNSVRAEGEIVKKTRVGGSPIAPKFEEKRLPVKVIADLANSDSKAAILSRYDVGGDRPHAIVMPYEQSNFFMTGPSSAPELDWSIDGMYHKEACRKAGDSEYQFIGWSIKGRKARSTGYVRFVSGRNLGKFRDEFRELGHESRDMPEVYAEGISRMLARDLNLTLDGAFETGTSGRGKKTRKWNFTVN